LPLTGIDDRNVVIVFFNDAELGDRSLRAANGPTAILVGQRKSPPFSAAALCGCEFSLAGSGEFLRVRSEPPTPRR
jgi:hypothetical protein